MISVRYQYDLGTPFVRRLYAVCTLFVRSLYAVCTLICVHQYDLSTLFVRWFAYISTMSVRNVLNLHDAGLKLAQLCTNIPISKKFQSQLPSIRTYSPISIGLVRNSYYDIRTIFGYPYDIRTISVRYLAYIRRTSGVRTGVHPAYIKHRRCTLHPPLLCRRMSHTFLNPTRT